MAAAEQQVAPPVDADAEAGDGGHEAYTNRELLQIISGRAGRLVDENEQEGLYSLLTDHAPRFAALLSHYKPPSEPSLQRLKAMDHLKGSMLEFVVKAAGVLYLDELLCLEVVEAFLVGGYRGTVREFTQQLKVATQMHTLLHKVLRFYRNERIFLLQCVRHILTNALDPSNQHYTHFAKFVDTQLKATLFDECWDQFKNSVGVASAQRSHRTPEMIQESLLWTLQEQVELLKVLHLCVALGHAPKGSLVGYAKFLNDCHFGQQQDCVSVACGRQSTLLLQRIAHLSSTLLPLLGGWGRLGKAGTDVLQSEDRHLKGLVDMVMHSWGATPPHTPTMLHVAALHYTLASSSVQDSGTVEQQVEVNQVHQLVGRALEGGALQYLRDVLTHDDMSLFHLCERETLHWIHLLLVSLHSAVGLDSLPCQPVLCDVISKLLACKSVRDEVWAKGLTEDLGMMLSIAQAAFPCTAAPLLDMLLLLSQDAEEVGRVVALLDQMAYFAEQLDMDTDHTPGQEEGTLVCSVGKSVYADSSLALGKEIIVPGNTLGSVVQLGADGITVVCWAVPYSAWDYLSLEAIHLYSAGHQFFGQVRQPPHVENMVQNMTKAARLVGQLLNNDATGGVADKLHPLTSMFYHYLARFSPLPCPPLGLLAACLECITAQLEQQPETFWNHLIQTGFLPHRLALAGPDKHSAPIAPGHFGQLLASHEQPRGRYVVTMATLDCVHMVLGVESGVRDSPELLACVMYLMEEVVPSHHKWRYTQTGLIDRMALKLLDVISAALQLRDSPLGQYVAQRLLYTPTGISLLNHITVGAAAVEAATVSWHDSRSEQKVEVLKSTLSLLESLLRNKQGQALSPLEEAFVHSGTGGGARGGAGLLRALASLLYPHKDPELTTCAVRLVGKLCQDMPMSVYASLGEEAPAIRDTLVARLCAGSSPRELVLSILDFIAGAIGTQPGLMELFLALRREEGAAGEGTEPSYHIEPESCLVPVMDLLEAFQDGCLPPDLASAALGVLHALWQERKDAALIALRQRPNFWCDVLSPLSRDWCVWYESEESIRQSTNLLRALTHLVGVVGSEAYYTAHSVDKDLCDVFSNFKERYLYWTQVCGPLPVDSVLSLPDDHPGRAALAEAHCVFIESWTRFLTIAAKLHPEEFSLGSDVVKGVLDCVLEGLESHTRRSTGSTALRATAHLSQLLLVLVKPALESQRVSPSNEMVERICQTFQHGWGMEDLTPTPPPVHTHLFAASIVLLKTARSTPGLLEPRFCLGFVPFIGRVLQRIQLTAPQQDTELDVLAVLLLCEVVQSCSKDETVWLPVLRQHAILLQIVHITDRAIRSLTLPSLAEACLSFLLTVASQKSAAKALVMNNIDHTLCLSLGNILALRAPSLHEDNPMETNGGSYGNWRRVWLKSLGLVTILLASLGHTYVSAGVDFVGVYQQHLSRALDISMATTAGTDLEEVLCAVSLVSRLTQFRERWHFLQPEVFVGFMRQCLLLCNSAVALLDNQAALRQACKLSGGEASPVQHEDSQPRGSADPPPEVDDLQEYQWTMVQILDRCVVTLQLYSPTLSSLLSEGVTEPAEWMPLVALTFSSPQVGVVDPPSLGTLTCALDVGRALLKDQAERGNPSNCKFLLSVLEHVVMFLLSQSTCCLAHPPPALEGGRRELLARELASELETFLSGMSRYFCHRGGHSPAVVSLSPSPHKSRSLDDSGSSRTTSSFSESPDQGVFRLVTLFVAQHLK